MNKLLNIYRFPLIMTALMLTALFIWAMFVWREIVDRSHQRQRVRFEIAANNLIAVDQHCALEAEVIREVIGNAMQNSSFGYFVLERNGTAEIKIGNPPDNLDPRTPEGELFQGNSICFWKTLKEGKNGNRIMIVGGSIENDRGYRTQSGSLLVAAILAVLLIFANLAAWILMIRGRLLSEQLDAQKARSAYLEDLELAAAGLAHETKNPLGIISGMAQQIANDPAVPEDILNKIEGIIDEVDKASSRLGHFLVYARNRDAGTSPVDLKKIIGKIAAILQVEFESARVTLDISCPYMTVVADEDMLRQILVNLLLNSLRASAQGTRVRVNVTQDGETACISVIDQGTGISPDLLPDIFKPYVAGFHSGHGLGLAIVKRLVESHSWTITAESAMKKGTIMTITGIAITEKGRENV